MFTQGIYIVRAVKKRLILSHLNRKKETFLQHFMGNVMS